jgi:hypothetical protein
MKIHSTELVREGDDFVIQGHEKDIILNGAALELEIEAQHAAGYYRADSFREDDGDTFEYDKDAADNYFEDNRVEFAQNWIDSERQTETIILE